MRTITLSIILSAISSPAFAHGAHVENLGGHSHMSAIVASVAFACLGAFIIRQRAR